MCGHTSVCGSEETHREGLCECSKLVDVVYRDVGRNEDIVFVGKVVKDKIDK